MKSIFVFLAILGAALAGDHIFEICPSAELAVLKRFSISDCPDPVDPDDPNAISTCTFQKGKTYTFELEAEILDVHPEANAVPYVVFVTIAGIPIRLIEGDACVESNLDCPIRPGSTVVVTIVQDIPASVPNVNRGKATARLWANEEGSNQDASLCTSINIRVE